MSLLEVTLAYTYANQQCINRWNYVGGGTPAAVTPTFGLASAFGAIYDEVAIPPAYPSPSILNALSQLLDNGVSFQQLTVINVYDPVDFYQTPFVEAYVGGTAGEGMSPVVAFGFRTNQVRRDVGRGTKRFAGVPEGRVGDLGVISGGALDDMNALADLMSEVLEYDDEGNTLTYTPCVVSKQRYNPETGLADPEGTAYRYIPVSGGGLAAQLARTAIGVTWQPYNTARSQVSRQYGHGR